MDDTDVTDNGA